MDNWNKSSQEIKKDDKKQIQKNKKEFNTALICFYIKCKTEILSRLRVESTERQKSKAGEVTESEQFIWLLKNCTKYKKDQTGTQGGWKNMWHHGNTRR